jgi:hypothetical protein
MKMTDRKEQQRDLVDELRPFFKGERRFDAGNPPTDISNDGLTVLRTVFALKEIHERIATNFLAMDDSDPESDFVRLARDWRPRNRPVAGSPSERRCSPRS